MKKMLTMKPKQYIIALLFLLNIPLNAQTEIPLRSRWTDLPDDIYLKDINNDLDPFVGTWSCTEGNKKYTINIKKLIKHHSRYYKDILIGGIKIEQNSIVLYDTTKTINYENTDLHGFGFEVNKDSYLIGFYDRQYCNASLKGKLLIDPSNSQKMSWEMEVGELYISYRDCPNQYDQLLDDPNFGSVFSLPFKMTLTKSLKSLDEVLVP